MDTRKKSMQELQKSVGEFEDKLAHLYTDMGSRLMNDPDASVPADTVSQFQNLQTRSAEVSHAIKEIQHGIERLEEITRFTREIDHHLDSLSSEYSDAAEELGRLIFENYSDVFRPSFETAFEIVRDEGAVMLEKQDRLADWQKRYASSGILGKLSIKTKMLALEASISQHKSKTSKAFREGGQSVLASGVLLHMSAIPEPLDAAYRACADIGSRIEDCKKRSASMAEEAAAVRSHFVLLGAGDNPRRYIETLKADIRSIDVRSRFIAADAGKKFVSMYIAEDGEIKAESAASFDVSSFKSLLESAAVAKKTLFVSKKRVQSISAEIQIASLEHVIEKKNADIESCKKKIQELEHLITDYTSAAAAAKEQISLLTKTKEECDCLI